MSTANSLASFQLLDWASVPIEKLNDSTERQMVWSERLMVCRLRFAPGTVTAIHTHPHDQVTLVVQGRVRFFVEGQPHEVSAGQVLVFPSNIEHGATMLDEEVVLIDIFTPIREDFLAGQSYGTR